MTTDQSTAVPVLFTLRHYNTGICNNLQRTSVLPVVGSLCPVLLSTALQIFAPHNDLSILWPTKISSELEKVGNAQR
jgi:hypothetical protein